MDKVHHLEEHGGNAWNNANGSAGGGAGNPGGAAGEHGWKGGNGTGGTLVVYSQTFAGTGKFVSRGAGGGDADYQYWDNAAGGGSSGSGAISIFAESFEEQLNASNFNVDAVSQTVSASTTARWQGGKGGLGTYHVGIISDGSYSEHLTNE